MAKIRAAIVAPTILISPALANDNHQEYANAARQTAGDLITATERRLSAEQRRALAMLATAGTNGLTQQLLVVCSSDASIVTALVDEGLATMNRGSVQVAGKMIEVATVRITDSGIDALASED